MNTLGQRIRQRRNHLKLTQKQVGASVGVSHVTISQWEKDETAPRGENLYGLCKALGCQPDWLLYGKEDPSPPGPQPEQNAEWAGTLDPWGNGTKLGEDEVELPFFTEVELSAGNGAHAAIETHGPKLRFAKSTLKRSGVSPDNAACVKVSGTSMEPVLPDGATVGIDTANTAIKDGDMFALDQGGMLRVKLVYRLPGGGLRLKSFNTDEYPDEHYDSGQAANIRIIGRVFWYSVLR